MLMFMCPVGLYMNGELEQMQLGGSDVGVNLEILHHMFIVEDRS
jgi:hypothetical protein